MDEIEVSRGQVQEDSLEIHKDVAPQSDLPLAVCLSQKGGAAWKEFFCPTSNNQNSILVPRTWEDFITTKLLIPADLEWARSILKSKVWQIIVEGYHGSVFRQYVVNAL